MDTFACIFVKRRSCGTESKAFVRSKKITSVAESLAEGLTKIVWQIRYFLDALTKTTKACLFKFKMICYTFLEVTIKLYCIFIVNLTFAKELFWREPFFRVSYTKMLIFGREKLSGYKYI